MTAGVFLLPRVMRRPVRREILRERLDALVAAFDISTITPDPLELVLRYDDPRDQEVAGLIAAAFAYGRADIVVANVGRVLDRMQPSPFAYLSSFSAKRAARDFAGFTHRFHKTPELVDLFDRIAAAISKHGSLGELFRRCYRANEDDIGPSLARFVEELCSGGLQAAGGLKPGATLLTSPRDGSACKRMNLFLHWLVRRTPPH